MTGNALRTIEPADVATLLREPRLSNCLTIVGENPEQAIAALPDDLRAALPSLITAARGALEPAQPEELVAALTRALSLGLGQGMSENERLEFQLAAAEELEALPREWAIEGLRKARQECKFAREIVPFVIAYAEDYPSRARTRLERLIALDEAARLEREPGAALLEASRI